MYLLCRLIKVLIYTTAVPCKVLEYILRLGDPSIEIAISVTSWEAMRSKHRKQCWQATGVGGQEGENKEEEEEEDWEGRREEEGSKMMKARIIGSILD